jgi:intein/homing endonuclease
MIVPNTNLVFQGNDDFEEYGIDKLDGVKIQQIGGGSKLKEGCDIIIGTFQSLVKRDKEFFEEVDAVFVDECLTPDSRVKMADGGTKRIDEIKKGDLVLTVNEKTNLLENKSVEYVYKNMNKGYQIYEVETEDGRIIRITGNHKVRLKSGEWKKVEDQILSDELFDI